jgi:glucosylceramidase
MAALTVTASLVLSTFAGAAVLAVEPEQPQQAYPAASDTAAFLDTEGHWAEDQVLRWNRLGIVNGVDAQHFAPNQQLTRVEFFAILGRALGGEERQTSVDSLMLIPLHGTQRTCPVR